MKALTNINSGSLVVVIGNLPELFCGNLAQELHKEIGLTVLVLRASNSPTPGLLANGHPDWATAIFVDVETPEQRSRELMVLADIVIRSVGPHEGRVIFDRTTRPAICLREPVSRTAP